MEKWTDDGTFRVCRLGETCRILLAGDLDDYAVERLPPAEVVAAGGNFKAVELDLSELNYIDSTGLRWLLRMHRAARAKGREMTVYVWEGFTVHRTIQLIGAGDLFPVEFLQGASSKIG